MEPVLLKYGKLATKYMFLPCDAMLARYMPSSCVCLFVTLWYCMKTAKRKIMQMTPHDSSGTLVFWR